MSKRTPMTALTAAALLTALLTGCSTVQENPNYQYSTKYKSGSPYGTQQPEAYGQTISSQLSNNNVRNASYQQTTSNYSGAMQAAGGTYTQLDHRCLRRETNRQLIGGAVGGTAGAIVGKKVIGGTKGTVAGALLGGAAGYGIGDKSINCDPVQVAIPQQAATVSPAYYAPQTVQQPQVVYANTQTVTAPIFTAPTDAAMPRIISSGYGTPGYQAMMNTQANDINALTPGVPSMINARSDTTPQFGGAYSTISSNQHQVIEGDTVYSFSRKLCSSIDEIQQLNSLSSDFSIKIGDTINLPSSRC